MPQPRIVRRACVTATLAVGLLVPTAAAAQEAPSERVDHVRSLKECRANTDPNERLACLDKAVDDVIVAAEAGELRFVDREDIRQTRRRLFGFSLPRIGLFGGGDHDDREDPEDVDMLESRITSIRYLSRDSFTFRIEEGDAVWQINEAPTRLRNVKPGAQVVFKRAALGSYFIRIDGQTGVKGRRIQ